MPSYNLTLTIDEINAILVGLQEVPARICNPLTEKIREQATKQIVNSDTSEPT